MTLKDIWKTNDHVRTYHSKPDPYHNEAGSNSPVMHNGLQNYIFSFGFILPINDIQDVCKS